MWKIPVRGTGGGRRTNRGFREKTLEPRAAVPIHCRPVPWDGVRTAGVGYPSGQRGQTVNLLAYAFTGSNPVPTTTVAGRDRAHGGGRPSPLALAAGQPVASGLTISGPIAP